MFEKLLSRRGISLERLRNFTAVAESGSIARVADGDPVRQSLISRQIGELEEFFGVELTRRRGKGIEPTPAGLDLAARIRLHLQGLEDFKTATADQPLEYRFAAGNSVIEWMLVPMLADLRKKVPGLLIHLFDERSKDVVQGLADHRYDFGLIRRSAVKRPLKFHTLRKIGYALYVPKAWGAKNEADILGKKPLASTFGGEFQDELVAAAGKCRKNLGITHHCTSFTQAAQLVRCGVAAAILPEMAEAALEREASRIELPWLSKYKREIGVAWHTRLFDTRSKAREVLEWLLSKSE